jgi:hypothetical protein
VIFLTGSGIRIRDEFFRIPDLFDYDYDFAPESIKSKKKVSFHSTFHVESGIRDEKMFGSGSGSRNEKWSDPDPG